ncbi:FMN-linked oxidoreductase [Setomelanomma holmii]|uniref:FMN-linked oxidoreductase n=1 Tax=Setomelanomma holmii TaxID=210430 RepID=A0A9P4LIS3_9PLEO|nr:FMN-linked oxidoreductase [Setomelanomma holmii]
MAASTTAPLFEPLRIGNIDLSHRIVFAPLTRFRINDDHVPLSFVKDYYVQRAATPGTLLISEAIVVSRLAGSITHMPEIWSDAQIATWKEIADAVHAKGSYIFLQLCANGRAASPIERQKDGLDLIGPSAIPISAEKEQKGIVATSNQSPVPREMTEKEIWQVIRDFARAAQNAVHKAGFGGVEINAANGHMLDQFIQDNANQRTDAWGGSIEKRSRFVLEIAKATIAAVGKEKVGFRVSPWSTYLSMRMADPIPQFTYLIRELSKLGVAFMHLVEPRISGDLTVEDQNIDSNIPLLEAWGDERPVIVAGGYSAESAVSALASGGQYEGRKVAVAFGRHFVSNPDLVFRVKNKVELAPYDRSTFYKVGSKDGYLDYPFSEAYLAQEVVAA